MVPPRMRPSAAISPLSRAVCARVPHTMMAAAASTLTTAKNPFAIPLRDPPNPNSAPWFTRGITGGERALAEVVGTQLIGRGATLEASCNANCTEISIIELVGIALSEEQKQMLSAGDILQVASSATPFLGQFTRMTNERNKKPGAAIVMFVTVSKREGARYTERQQFIARIGGAPVATGEPTALAAPDPESTPKVN